MKLRQYAVVHIVIRRLRGDHGVEQLDLFIHAAGCARVNEDADAVCIDEDLRGDGGIDLAYAAV